MSDAAPLSDGERIAGFLLAVLAAAAFVALRHDQPALLVFGLVVAALLGFATFRRARIGTAAASFVTAFGPWGLFAIAGAVYAGFALWLLARATSSRARNEGTPAAPSAAARASAGSARTRGPAAPRPRSRRR